jgi:tRNA(Leu) C34 or U34 (ribose-2'-O)-methylase TrmL
MLDPRANLAMVGGMRGFFGIGVAGISKSMNVGSLFRTAHAFGASFVFTVGAKYARRVGRGADTANTPLQVPYYDFPDADSLVLPEGTELVGIEIVDDAIELPSFRHPRQAAYILGAERISLPPDLLAKCSYVVRIPTHFSINVGLAGAIVMYDRLTSLGRFARRPVTPRGVPEPVPEHVFGTPRFRTQAARFRATLPDSVETNRKKP